MMAAAAGAMGPEAKDGGQFLEAAVEGNRFSPGDPEGTSSATPNVSRGRKSQKNSDRWRPPPHHITKGRPAPLTTHI